MIPVKQYIDEFVAKHRGSVVIREKQGDFELVDWNKLLLDAGYYSEEFGINTVGSIDRVLEIMTWLKNTIGERNHTWTGQQIWFDRKEDLVLFILTWK